MAINARYNIDTQGNRWKSVEICLKCGACCTVAQSCHVMYDSRFSPQYTYVYDCFSSEKGSLNPNIWLCVSCHKCEEVCPYDVSPISFIEAIKGEALESGFTHPTILSEVSQIVTTGYAFPITATTTRLRQSLKLALLSTKAANELWKIALKTGLKNRLSEANE